MPRLLLLCPALAVLVLGPATTARADAPADHVDRGVRLYEQKKYPAALESFRRAVRANKKNAMARFHYARALAALRQAGQVCEYNAYRHDIMHQLTVALRLDATMRARIQGESVFQVVRDKVAWQVLVEGRSLAKKADVEAILQGVTWHGQAHGVCGSTSLKLKEKGVAELWRTDLKSPDGDDCETKLMSAGGWAVKGTSVTIKLPKAIEGRKTLTGNLSKAGRLSLPDEGGGPFSDDPDECGI